MDADWKAAEAAVVRGRFAPSPTGELHLGHAQTMLLCWLQVRALDGVFVLRTEDVDRGRARAGAEEAIYADLAWLGFDWDEGPGVGGPAAPYRQSERSALYERSLERLSDRLFPCSCTRREVRDAARVGDDHHGELAYPGTCRSGPSTPGRPTALRVRVDPGLVSWDDLSVGPCSEEPSTKCGDFIVRTKAGDFAYQLACVADDIAMGITHVLRGRDLTDSTGRQLLLYRWLGASPPRFAHVPLRTDDVGVRLAKSCGSPGLSGLRAAGEDPRVVIGSLAQDLGLVRESGLRLRPGELIDAFGERFANLLTRSAAGADVDRGSGRD